MKLFNNKKKSILSILVCVSVAAPIVCLPLGIRQTGSPAILVREAYAATFPEEFIEGEEGETAEWDWSDYEYDENIANGGTIQSTYNDGFGTNIDMVYSDVPSYTVYQQYDEADLPIELVDPMFFAPDETTYYIKVRDSILKETPDMSSITVQTLAWGEEVVRIGVGDTWSKIVTEDGAEGYVLTSSISDEMVWIDIDNTVWVDADSLSLRAEPSTQSEVITFLANDTRLRCIGVSAKWYHVITPDGEEGYVYISYTDNTPPTPTPTPRPANTGGGGGNGGGGGGGDYSGVHGQTWVNTGNNGQTIANIAVSMLGTPYVYATASSTSVDCSGLVVYCYRQLGVSLPHQANALCSVGEPVSRSNIQPGDIVCWTRDGSYSHHCGIYVGGGQCVEARGAAWGTVYCSVDKQTILAIRRIFV